MDFSQIIVLSFIQGFTEFLPISSSAHLVLVRELLGWDESGSLAFDVALHVGTLSAILFYFRSRLGGLLCDFFASILKRKMVGDSRLVWAVGLGTVPVGLFGLCFGDILEQYARSWHVIAATSVLFGILLVVADKKAGAKNLSDITISLALIIGLAQAVALIPGVSRSGITMTAALFLGFSRTSSAEFSFLLSIPVIVLAGALEGAKIAKNLSELSFSFSDVALGVLLSFVFSYACVKLFMAIITRLSMLPFAIYRIALGLFLFLYFG
ncbi:undecaprenyl-diphosphate phosphatase [Campylobacter sp. 19-13652]|uniref:undecaprenyl-diphosphate phosphatase n=1 Tax=Campylobacter sp. 19-13652 TaxID=2840180 RepID=UPI001C751192|nr:undecaprenyl-diphosphate phosphatase [Campylobacter sp. 19-13652]BCX78725.1 undecaprenyl-diphosphatase [Campylobacter sp. 19-13652]